MDEQTKEAIELLKQLVETPSLSKEEHKTALVINDHLRNRGVEVSRILNNIWAKNKYYDPSKPTILLNSHHDTVKPNSSYTRDPFKATVEGDQLFGLGSNDAGGCLVALIAVFLNYHQEENLKYNFVLAASAEEEISGKHGVALLLPELGSIDFGIVGEPTEMNAAIAEKGLMVLDCTAVGKAGHAARNEGVNAIYEALDAITWFKDYQFPKESSVLGPVKMTVSVVNAGTQHNVVPDQCHFTVDVRNTDAYSNEELLAEIKRNVNVEVKARSTRLNPSSIPHNHPFIKTAIRKGAGTYGSPTLSDQALMSGFPTVKMGPGKSERSHTADEFVLISEIAQGIDRYISILDELVY